MRKREDLTQDKVRDLLDYDPETGKFTWKDVDLRSGKKNGDEAGYISYDKSGYARRMIVINRNPYWAHRLAWFYVHGQWPGLIDHIDRDSTNNRLSNLREATKSQNNANTETRRTGVAGFRGVSLSRNKKRYRAQISVGNRCIPLGHYDTPEDAHDAWRQAAKKFRGEVV